MRQQLGRLKLQPVQELLELFAVETAGLRGQQVTAVTQELLPFPFLSDLCLVQRGTIGEQRVSELFPVSFVSWGCEPCLLMEAFDPVALEPS